MSNKEIVQNLQPKKVFEYFAEVSEIPRGTGNTEGIIKYLFDLAIKNNLKYKKDNYDNVILEKEGPNKIILQAHTDMVCVKSDYSNKDMTKEGIEFILDDNWLKAKDTSLGADDGIGVAMILAALTDKEIDNGIVGLFTSDEEGGLDGARGLDISEVKANYLINLDSEEFGTIDIGCAGGTHLIAGKTFDRDKIYEVHQEVKIEVSGGLGGHSGCDATKKRANANRVLIKIMNKLLQEYDSKFRLIKIEGGEF